MVMHGPAVVGEYSHTQAISPALASKYRKELSTEPPKYAASGREMEEVDIADRKRKLAVYKGAQTSQRPGKFARQLENKVSQVLAQGKTNENKIDGVKLDTEANQRRLDQLITMQQARAKAPSGAQWCFVAAAAPGAPEPTHYYEHATKKIRCRTELPSPPDGSCSDCFQARVKFIEGKRYMVMGQGDVPDDKAPLQPIDKQHVLKECLRFKLKDGIELKGLANVKGCEGVFQEISETEAKARACFADAKELKDGSRAPVYKAVPFRVIEWLPFMEKDLKGTAEPGAAADMPVLDAQPGADGEAAEGRAAERRAAREDAARREAMDEEWHSARQELEAWSNRVLELEEQLERARESQAAATRALDSQREAWSRMEAEKRNLSIPGAESEGPPQRSRSMSPFTLPDSPLAKAEMRKRRQEDMASMAAAGLECERKFLRLCGREDASTATTPSEAGSAGVTPSSDGSQMGEDFCEACQGPCKEGSMCPPSSKMGSSDGSDFEPFPGGEVAPTPPPMKRLRHFASGPEEYADMDADLVRALLEGKRDHDLANSASAAGVEEAGGSSPKRAGTSGDASLTGASEDNVTASSTTASSAAEPDQTEQPAGADELEAAPLKVLDTVKILAGPCAGEEGIVSEVKGDKSEVDEVWYSRSELEKLF